MRAHPDKGRHGRAITKTLKEEGVPHIVFINKIDTLDGSIADTLAALQAYAASPLVLRQMPIFDGPTVTGYVDLMSERAYRYRKGQASELMQIPAAMLADEQVALGRLVETLADHDDALLEKVLEDIKPTPDELYRDMRKDLVAGSVIEVFVGAAENANGVRRLWKALRHDTPDPSETAERREIVPGGAPRAQVFKTAYAGHTGKLSYARIWSGTISDGAQLGGTRLGGIYRFVGGDLTRSQKQNKAISSHSAVSMVCRPAPPCRLAGNRNPCPFRRLPRPSMRWRLPRPTGKTM